MSDSAPARVFLAVVDETTGLLGSLRPEDRVSAFRELFSVLRAGGRVVVVLIVFGPGRAELWRSDCPPITLYHYKMQCRAARFPGGADMRAKPACP